MRSLKELVKSLNIKNELIKNAFLKVDRKDFVMERFADKAYADDALPIDFGATISQPSTILFMLEKLDPRPGDKIFEAGTGSGYVTALLAEIVGEAGEIYSIEFIPELFDFAQKNLKKYDFKNIHLEVSDARNGWIEQAPFDRIISGASADFVPPAWKEQLKVGGRMVTPVQDSIIVLEKFSGTEFKEKEYPGFIFVTLQSF